MTAWKGIKGSRYWEGLFGATALPGNSKGMLHFYHRQVHLYPHHPGEEPNDSEPVTLFEVQQKELPAPVPSLKPTAEDAPSLRHFIYPGAPAPLKHTLAGV